MLANGKRQTALGKINWKGEIQGLQVDLTLFIMRDTDLTVPIILGMDFLLLKGIVFDFQKAQYALSSAIGAKPDLSFPFLSNAVCSTVHFHLAIPNLPVTDDTFRLFSNLLKMLTLNPGLKRIWKILC